jgi:hypothetical protein
MGFLNRIFGRARKPESSEEGHIGAVQIGDIIADRAARFRGGRGMVLLLQEGLRIRAFFFDGVPRCSWNYTDNQLRWIKWRRQSKRVRRWSSHF